MSYHVIFVGIVNFHELQPKGRLALMPDGRSRPPIEPHLARIFVVESYIVDASGWWPRVPMQSIEHPDPDRSAHMFPIEEPSTLSMSGVDSEGPYDENEFEHAVELDGVRVDPGNAATIARLPIRQGTLRSRLIGDTGLVAELESSHDGQIVITARFGGKDKTLILRAGAEIVIANISDNFDRLPTEPEQNHYRLYELLDGRRPRVVPPSESAIRAVAADVPELTSGHPFIRHLRSFGLVPDIQCIINKSQSGGS